MGKKIVKLNESTLKKMIIDNVKSVLKEEYDWDHYNDGPSEEEETFEEELYSVIEGYGLNIARAIGKEDFINWCVEIINKTLNSNRNLLKPVDAYEPEVPMRGEY